MRNKFRFTAILLTALICFNLTAFSAPFKDTRLRDLENHWSSSMVKRLVDYGVVNGYDDKTFRPENQVNVDEFIKMVLTAIGYDLPDDQSYWAWEYINKAIELEMIEVGEYDAYDVPINRSQMAKIVSLALSNVQVADFVELKKVIYDYAEIPVEYKDFVLIAYGARTITGYENETFRPLNYVTRAEAATVLVRLIDKNGGISLPTGIAKGDGGVTTGTVTASAKLYVATNGKDTNDGSENAPFLTVERAKEAIRAMNNAGNYPDEGVTVYLREGVYRQFDSVVFEEDASGKENGKVVITAYPGEDVRITGSEPIEKKWFTKLDDKEKSRVIDKKAADKILVADLKSNGITEYGELNTRGYHYFNKGQYMAAELIVNGENQTLSRYPNEGTITVKNDNLMPEDLAFKYDISRPDLWKNAEDLWICGTLAINYENNYFPVKEINTSQKTITLREGKIRTYYTNGWFFAENLIEEIDEVGEYYIDREAGKLYYYPPADFQSKDYTIELSTLAKPMFHFNGAKHISVRNIVMDGGRGYAALGTTKDYKMMTYGDFLAINNVTNPVVFDTTSKNATKMLDPKNFPEAQVFPGHIWDGFLDDGDGVLGIEFINCEIKNFGQGGLIFRGTQVKINNNHITNIGGTGIYLIGGNFETLEPTGNEIKNNDIHRIGYQHRAYHPGIAIQGVGIHVAYNDLYDAPHCVLNYHGNDHIIEYNKIHDAVKECLDMDAIYTRNEYIPQWRGTVIRNNYIYNMGIYPVGEYTKQLNVSGIRTDNYGYALQIYNNIFANIGTAGANSVIAVTAQGNRNMIVGNLFIDCSTTFRGWDTYSAGSTWDMSRPEMKERVELAKKYSENPIFAEKYPELATFDKEYFQSVATNTFESNLVVNLKFKLSETNGKPNPDSTRGAPELIVTKDNVVVEKDPGFVNYGAGNYELSENSEVLKKLPHFENFKMTDFGPQETVGPTK